MIGIGVDLVDVDDFRARMERTPGLAERLFLPAERDYADRRRDPAERYAVRFAAKEAVMKALGVGLGEVEFHDIEVVRDDDSGRPHVVLRGRAARLAAERGVTAWLLTLTHTDHLAEAIAVAV